MAKSKAQRRQPVDENVQASQELQILLRPIVQGTDFCNASQDRYWSDVVSDRGLIPSRLMESLSVIMFLARNVLHAQDAQRRYGVPASVLMSIALNLSAWGYGSLSDGNGWFEVEARRLVTSDRYRVAILSADDASLYVRKLDELGYCDEIDVGAEDILSPIEQYDLTACDLAGILPIGEYRAGRYRAVRSEAGRIELRPAMDMRELGRRQYEEVARTENSSTPGATKIA
jgi:hypothetical protein